MGNKRLISAGEFKAKCLALLDEVAQNGQEIVVTKRGRAVARLIPMEGPRSLRGSIISQGDLVSPIGDDWEAGR